MNTSSATDATSPLAHFIIYVCVVLSLLMVLFPPFSSLNGTEHAFLLSGPEWSRDMRPLADQLGLTARIDWIALAAQLLTVWAIGLGAVWFLGRSRSTSRAFALGLAACLGFTVLAQDAAAQTDATPAVGVEGTVGVQGGKYGIGFGSSWPSYGLSGTLQISETLTAEAMVGFLGALRNFGAKGWYRFNRNDNYDLYGYATVNLFQYSYDRIAPTPPFERIDDTENVLGLGAGAGIEAGIQTLFKDADLPPIFLNWEIGIGYADFDFYDFSAFVFGGGIHYRFGAR